MPPFTKEQEDQIRLIFRDELSSFIKSDRFVFEKHLQVMDGKNVQFARGTGTKMGTATDQKVAFYGVTPVVQAGAIASPSGGATIDAAARTAIDAIRVAIKNFGITA